jgi:hypothetical protein
MNRHLWLASAALFLVACGEEPPPDEPVTTFTLSADVNGFNADGIQFTIFGQREIVDDATGNISSTLSIFASDDAALCDKAAGETFQADFENGLVAGKFAGVIVDIEGGLPQVGDIIASGANAALTGAFASSDGTAFQLNAATDGSTGSIEILASDGALLSFDAQGLVLEVDFVQQTQNLDTVFSLNASLAARCEALDNFGF